jgi:hypothetical protein
MAKTTVYRARDAAAAQRVVDGLAAVLEPMMAPVDGVKGLPGSRCMHTEAAGQFSCWATADRYAFEGAGSELLDAQQQMAAQYLLLTAR